MPKIPNYTAKHDEKGSVAYRWEHDEKENVYVVVEKMDVDSDYWVVRIFHLAKFKELAKISKNKRDMRKYAVEWMRENPEGIELYTS